MVLVFCIVTCYNFACCEKIYMVHLALSYKESVLYIFCIEEERESAHVCACVRVCEYVCVKYNIISVEM